MAVLVPNPKYLGLLRGNGLLYNGRCSEKIFSVLLTTGSLSPVTPINIYIHEYKHMLLVEVDCSKLWSNGFPKVIATNKMPCPSHC
jgi:hypothetical protein